MEDRRIISPADYDYEGPCQRCDLPVYQNQPAYRLDVVLLHVGCAVLWRNACDQRGDR